MAGFTNYLEDKIINHLFGDDTGASLAHLFGQNPRLRNGLRLALSQSAHARSDRLCRSLLSRRSRGLGDGVHPASKHPPG